MSSSIIFGGAHVEENKYANGTEAIEHMDCDGADLTVKRAREESERHGFKVIGRDAWTVATQEGAVSECAETEKVKSVAEGLVMSPPAEQAAYKLEAEVTPSCLVGLRSAASVCAERGQQTRSAIVAPSWEDLRGAINDNKVSRARAAFLRAAAVSTSTVEVLCESATFALLEYEHACGDKGADEMSVDTADHVPYNPTEVAEMMMELGRNGGAAFPREVDPDEVMRAVEEFRESAVAYATAVEKYGGHDLQTESRAADDIVQRAVVLWPKSSGVRQR